MPTLSPPQLEWSERVVTTASGERTVLLASLRTSVLIGTDRSAGAGATYAEASGIDEQIVDAVAARQATTDVVLFRARGGTASGSWGFSADLTDDELSNLGYAMVKGQLALYRRLARMGVTALAGVEFGERESEAFQRGTARLTAEMERTLRESSGAEAAVLRFDLWLLDHLALWSDADLDGFLRTELPRLLGVLERRRKQLDELLREVPAEHPAAAPVP